MNKGKSILALMGGIKWESQRDQGFISSFIIHKLCDVAEFI